MLCACANFNLKYASVLPHINDSQFTLKLDRHKLVNIKHWIVANLATQQELTEKVFQTIPHPLYHCWVSTCRPM